MILALPFGAAVEAIKQAEDLTGKVLVDISNPISPDYKELVIGHTTSAAEEIQKLAPQAYAVKAFNTIFAQLLAPEARQARSCRFLWPATIPQPKLQLVNWHSPLVSKQSMPARSPIAVLSVSLSVR